MKLIYMKCFTRARGSALRETDSAAVPSNTLTVTTIPQRVHALEAWSTGKSSDSSTKGANTRQTPLVSSTTASVWKSAAANRGTVAAKTVITGIIDTYHVGAGAITERRLRLLERVNGQIWETDSAAVPSIALIVTTVSKRVHALETGTTGHSSESSTKGSNILQITA
jgi:hypothetical protein